jgi:hypothetical protein
MVFLQFKKESTNGHTKSFPIESLKDNRLLTILILFFLALGLMFPQTILAADEAFGTHSRQPLRLTQKYETMSMNRTVDFPRERRHGYSF